MVAYSFTDKVADLEVGQQVTYRHAPMSPDIPSGRGVVTVQEISEYRSRTTGNQLVKIKGDMFIRDVNELNPVIKDGEVSNG